MGRRSGRPRRAGIRLADAGTFRCRAAAAGQHVRAARAAAAARLRHQHGGRARRGGISRAREGGARARAGARPAPREGLARAAAARARRRARRARAAARREGAAERRCRARARLGLRRRALDVGRACRRDRATGRHALRGVLPHARRTSSVPARSGSTSRYWGRCCRRRRIRAGRRWAGRASRRLPRETPLPIYALGGLEPADLPSRSRTARMVSRCAARRGPPSDAGSCLEQRSERASRRSGCRRAQPRDRRRRALRRSGRGRPRLPTRRNRSACNARSRTAASAKPDSIPRPRRIGDRRSSAASTSLRDCRTRARIPRRGRRRRRGPFR